MVDKAIGIDLGGTFIKAGVVTAQGKVISRVSIPTDVDQGRAAIIRRIAEAATAARDRAGLTWRDIGAIGLGSPGVFEPPHGLVSHSPNLKSLQGMELARPVKEELGLKDITLVLENDANVAAFAEAWVGAGRDVKTLVMFTLGTGIGGGIVLDGRIWRGAWGTAGELGHMNLIPDGTRCGCGNTGCIEAYASATGLVRRFKEAVAAGKRTRLARLVNADEPVSARQIAQAARAGDRLSAALMEETGRYLGVMVMNMLHILNVEMVVFAGGMTASGKLLLDPIRQEARKRSFPLAFRGVKILFSRMGNDAGLIGAAGWAMKQADAPDGRRF